MVPFIDQPDSIIKPLVQCSRHWRRKKTGEMGQWEVLYFGKAAIVITSLSSRGDFGIELTGKLLCYSLTDAYISSQIPLWLVPIEKIHTAVKSSHNSLIKFPAGNSSLSLQVIPWQRAGPWGRCDLGSKDSGLGRVRILSRPGLGARDCHPSA